MRIDAIFYPTVFVADDEGRLTQHTAADFKGTLKLNAEVVKGDDGKYTVIPGDNECPNGVCPIR